MQSALAVFAEYRAVKETELAQAHKFVRSMRQFLNFQRRFPDSATLTAAIQVTAEQYGLGESSTRYGQQVAVIVARHNQMPRMYRIVILP